MPPNTEQTPFSTEVPTITPIGLTPSTPIDFGCIGTKPSPPEVWTCVDGKWTAVGNVQVSEPRFIITGPTVINGTLSVPGDIVFSGVNNQLTAVDGCILINGSIVIELSETDAEQIRQHPESYDRVPLIAQDTSCSNSLSEVTVSLSVSGKKTCKKLSVTSSDSDPAHLTALFRVESKTCNNKWIIVGSVLGAVVLLSAVGVILYFALRPDPLKSPLDGK
jgi:hypothetical protein